MVTMQHTHMLVIPSQIDTIIDTYVSNFLLHSVGLLQGYINVLAAWLAIWLIFILSVHPVVKVI